MKFTDRSIATFKPKAERYEVWEDGRTGLGVRVSPKGRKSWVYLYRFGGKVRRMGFGVYPTVSLASARVAHAAAKEMLTKGTDPGAQQVERKRAERSAETVNDIAEEYLEKWARPRKQSAGEDERILRKDVLPAWGTRKANDIRRRDVIRLQGDRRSGRQNRSQGDGRRFAKGARAVGRADPGPRVDQRERISLQ